MYVRLVDAGHHTRRADDRYRRDTGIDQEPVKELTAERRCGIDPDRVRCPDGQFVVWPLCILPRDDKRSAPLSRTGGGDHERDHTGGRYTRKHKFEEYMGNGWGLARSFRSANRARGERGEGKKEVEERRS